MADDKRYSLYDLEAAGYEIGHMVAALMRGAFRGMADYDGQSASISPEGEAEAAQTKTRIADCRACWCDSCAGIEACTLIRKEEEPDGERPNPCVGCLDGMRFMPREREAACGQYEPFDGVNNG